MFLALASCNSKQGEKNQVLAVALLCNAPTVQPVRAPPAKETIASCTKSFKEGANLQETLTESSSAECQTIHGARLVA